MSCDNKTGPINIIQTSTSCDLKCQFMYKYINSGIIVTKNDLYISLKLTDNSHTATYNSSNGTGLCSELVGGGNYSVDEIRIYTPSLHTYNGQHSNAELIIYHKNTIGGKNLIVCIPISSNMGSQHNGSTQLSSLINYISANPTDSNVRGITFNLNDFIPKEHYYTYTATLPYNPCTSCIDYIVFDLGNGSIKLPLEILNKLEKIISKNNTQIQSLTNNLDYAYSKNIPIYGFSNSDRDIYIECNPTGSDGEVLIENNKETIFSGNSYSLLPTMNINTFYNFIIVSLLLLIIFGFIYLSNKLNKTTNTSSTSSIQSGGSIRAKVGGICRGGSINKIDKINLKL